MIAHKYAARLAALLMALAVLLCAAATAYGGQITQAAGGAGVTMQYESRLFDTAEPLSINLIVAEADWQSLLENASAEEYVPCDVEINGELLKNVGLRAKGNTSLSSIANDPTTDRYSFKLEFDHYVDGQSCYGLDKLILNNNYADATSMKEALVYDLFHAMGADASLYNYARLSVNGEYWGAYLALEAVEESFLLRNYGVKYGELYKPDGMEMGGGKGAGGKTDAQMDFPAGGFLAGEGMPQMPEGMTFDGEMPGRPEDFSAEEPMGGFMRGGFSGGSGGANLNYTDDELDSYSTIWEGEVTNTSPKDRQRVVAALKRIAAGEGLEEVMDVDNLMAYMAVHIFSVNDDSLSGSMAHNYYLYESNGRLNLIPWDYNLAFGGMGGGSATYMVNEPIDEAFDSTEFFDTLMADEEYHARYWQMLRQVVEYVQGGGLDEFYTRTRSQLDALVKEDPTAFYTYEEYDQAASALYELVKLRAQSIEAQMDGSISPTQSGRSSADALVDASGYSLSALGSMNNGGGRMDRRAAGESTQAAAPSPTSSFSDAGGAQTSPTSQNPPDRGEEQPPETAPEGGRSPQDGEAQEPPAGEAEGDSSRNGGRNGFSREGGQAAFPGGDKNVSLNAGRSAALSNLAMYGGCFLLMLCALLFVSRFRRH